MTSTGERSGGVVLLTFEQIFELLESTALNSPADLLCRVEGLLLRGTGATSVDGFLVDRWFNKLLHFSAVKEGDADSEEEPSTGGRVHGGGRRKDQRVRRKSFDTRAECDIGDGVAGVAAMTGRKLRVRDCRAKTGRRPQNPVYSTRHASGSLVCWPVRTSSHHTATTPANEPHPTAQLEDVEIDADRNDEPAGAMQSATGILAVLQLHFAEDELSPEALKILNDVGRLLAPLLSEALARVEEDVRRRSAEALLSLSRIVPRQMGLITMIDEIVRVTKRLTEAEGVWFFFVNHETQELWVAESGNLGEEKLRIGEGLCGHAAATGGIVNVIDSCSDTRFDRRWDERSGLVTKSALCVPVPPPEYTHMNVLRYTGSVSPRNRRATESRVSSSPSSPSSSLSQQCHKHEGPRSIGEPGRSTPQGTRDESSNTSARPLAVLKVTNKRGRGIFHEHEERALVRLCAAVETLLRSKAAEVSLLWSGMTERTLIRKSNNRGGAGGAWSNHAQVESTIMRLYSEASYPADAVAERRLRKRSASEGRQRALSDSTNDAYVDLAKQESDGSPERHTYGSSGGKRTVDGELGLLNRMPTEEWELVDLGMSLFELSSEQLLSLVARFFRNMELTNKFQISEQKMWSFLRAVDQRYRPNAFHNLIHAVSVTHVSFAIVKTTEISSLLRPLDKLALLVAAFCHDIDHPGNNNAYEVNSVSPLALQYGDSSVLERHHVFVTYQVLLQEGGMNNVFSGLTRAQFRDARQTIVQAILGTDMSSHMEHCANVFQFAQKAERQSADEDTGGAGGGLERTGSGLPADTREALDGVAVQPPPPWRVFCVEKPEDRSFLTKTIVHCADLSGQVLDRPLALEWGRRILEEFRLQARLEANTGLPRTTVASGDMETTVKGQHFFAVKIVKPLWEPFVSLFPKLTPLLESLNNNGEYYRQEGLRLERIRLSATSNSSSTHREGREGHEDDGNKPGGGHDNDCVGSKGNKGEGGGRACGGDDQTPSPTGEAWAGAGTAAAGEGGGLHPVGSNGGGGGG
eukprot:g10792.t1